MLTRSAFAVGPVKSGQAKANEPPEAKLGLRGVGEQDGQFVALVEDMGSKAVQRLKREDKVASGSIKAIDLDGIVYENGGKQTRVTIGNNLLGAPLPAPPPPPPKPPAAGPQPGQPGGPPQPGMEGQPQPGQPGRPPRLPRG